MIGLDASNAIDVSSNAQTLNFSSNDSQSFTSLDDGTAYAVTSTQPSSPNQVCSVTGGTNGDGTGNLSGSNIAITVTCTTDQYLVGGSVVGLQSGNSVVLDINSGAETLSVSSNTFVFLNSLTDGASYTVTVLTNPTSPNQTCGVSDGTGSINGADVVNIVITCSDDTFFIGGNVTGLHAGTQNTMILQNNNGDNLTIVGNGAFVFVTPLLDLQDYNVSVQSQPSSPIQNCTVVLGGGSIAGDDVDNVEVNCEYGDDLIYLHGFEDAIPVSR